MAAEKQRAGAAKKACCLISEFLEEAGIDREKARRLRRQLLEGIILMCRWQLERMQEDAPPPPDAARKGRKVTVE